MSVTDVAPTPPGATTRQEADTRLPEPHRGREAPPCLPAAIPGLTAVSLFGGIEGFGLALERCGVRVVASVEIDPDCRAVTARHFPATHQFDDVTEITSEQLIAAGFVPGRGILAGGWPCQDLSIAGRRAGLGGARSGLFWHIVRLADELRPRWLLLENVPGLLSAVCCCPGDDTCTANARAVRCGEWDKRDGQRVWLDHVQHTPPGGACRGGCMAVHGGAMGAVVGALEKLGYGLCWRVLDSQFLGVPQRRERVFLVGCLGDGAAPVEVLLEPAGGQGHPSARRAARESSARRASGSSHGARTVGTLGGSGPGGGWRVGADEAAAGQLVTTLQGGGRRGHRIDAEGAAGGHLIPLVTSAAITAHHGKGPDSDATNGLIVDSADSDAASGLIATPQTAVRRLTPKECERLQAFPDDWTRWKLVNGEFTEQSDSARYRQVGNAVTVSAVQWIAGRIVALEAARKQTRQVPHD